MKVTVNNVQKLFVFEYEHGTSCLGFKNLFDKLSQISDHFGLAKPVESEIGSLEQYAQYENAMRTLRESGGIKKTFFNINTPKKVQKILEDYRKSEEDIRVFYGDHKSGRDWLEEYDTIGRIGRTGGLLKAPILVANDECGGPALLDHCIVKLQEVATGSILWQHKSYQAPQFKIQEVSGFDDLTHEVLVNDVSHARFRSFSRAAHWVAFMSGETCCRPS